MWPFRLFLIVHVLAGASGLLLFWVPVGSRKGAPLHRYWGRVFCWLMLVTASMAVCMGTCTVLDPRGTHPQLAMTEDQIRGVFGWMMIYLAVLTVSLVWHGLRSVANRARHWRNRQPADVALQALVLVTALQCALMGWRIGQPLMLGMPVIGLASVGTNLWFAFQRNPGPRAYLMEHVKALVGAGISVYTAFTAFGAVHLLPKAALNPVTWSLPLMAGLALILYHWKRIRARG